MKVQVLDGGLGTTLEDVLNVHISDTPLWSAKLLVEDPEVLIQAHLAFLEAGATVIQTATYQCSFETFDAAGHAREEAVQLMRRAVQLAEEARSRFLASGTSTTPPDIRIALSLGPFGASLSPGQEYGGVYPPPYGPQAYSSTRKNRNVFTPDERTQGAEDSAVTALAAWHLARLRAFADDMHTWNTIDMLAFETIPLRIEARAICKAVATLRESAPAKAWWLSAVFPSGCAPDAEAGSGVEALVHVLAGGPDGVGINCTPPEFVGALVQEMQAEVARGTWRPWLALYPNGGGVYDPVARTWGAGEGKGAGGWASGVADIVRRAEADGVFGRVVVGGCCKTTPDDIATLAKLVAHSTQ